MTAVASPAVAIPAAPKKSALAWVADVLVWGGVAAVLHAGHVADAAVYLHPAESGVGMREIKAFASGLLEFRITIEGNNRRETLLLGAPVPTPPSDPRPIAPALPPTAPPPIATPTTTATKTAR